MTEKESQPNSNPQGLKIFYLMDIKVYTSIECLDELWRGGMLSVEGEKALKLNSDCF